jgi:hypothetical protein
MRMSAPLLAIAGLAALAPGASAATLAADSRCYQETQEVVLRGEGFAPNRTVTISREGTPIGSATTDAAGAWRGKFATQELPRRRREQVYDLAATDGTTSAVTRYRVTKVFADFSPGRGNPSTLRVRFTVNGFNLLRRPATVYLHYVRPNGKARRTISLGAAKGTCGVIRRTARRPLFPFTAERGRWILQFDTNKTYKRATQRAKYVWVRKPVQVFNRG